MRRVPVPDAHWGFRHRDGLYTFKEFPFGEFVTGFQSYTYIKEKCNYLPKITGCNDEIRIPIGLNSLGPS